MVIIIPLMKINFYQWFIKISSKIKKADAKIINLEGTILMRHKLTNNGMTCHIFNVCLLFLSYIIIDFDLILVDITL